MLSTCARGPGPPQVGPGPPRAIRTPADGSGTSPRPSGPPTCVKPIYRRDGVRGRHVARRRGRGRKPSAGSSPTCPANTGAGTSLPLEAPSLTRIKCEWLRRALLPLGTGQLLSVHSVDRELPRRAVKSQRHAWAASHDDLLLTTR